MANVLIVAYLLIVLAMIAVILLQRSEGGALGIGGGTNSFMTVRGSANVLTRTTAILAALFFATAIGLTILNETGRSSRSILQQVSDSIGNGAETTNVLDALNQLQAQSGGEDPSLALPPAGTATTTTAPAETPAPAPASDPALALPAVPAETPAPAN